MEDLLADEESLTRTDSVSKKRVRHEFDESGLDSPDVKRLRDDLFDDSGHDSSIQDLDSVIKSFEDELSTTTAQVSGETQPDLGYLFEASDDELGLPPPPPPPPTLPAPSCDETEVTVTELVRASSDTSEVGDLCGFEDHVTGFGSFELDDGLFEYSDYLDPGDHFPLRPESLPAE
ncbi:hypothetical protein EUTSA_v10005009mg [Eutrema salsugineum]|uniref:Uncharacterized protein n=1 Tax=Eutrema salsugineum TaxID=72664 RepID=V4KSB9_EUTSA|nr:uncharacterized protein LOC18013043 [Eutrema salsugineum]ESQ32902.1 hypothetical protein EUTSA_v10005009mg [Eutrema salsugineum]